jgi:hypothetical protein
MTRLPIPLVTAAVVYSVSLSQGPVSMDATAQIQWGGRGLGLLLHLTTVGLIFELWRRRVGRDDDALWAATLFAVLPACSEAVISAAGRGPQLATILTLLALALHVRGRGPARPIGIFLLQVGALQLHLVALALAPLVLVHDALMGSERTTRDSLVGFAAAAGGAVLVLVMSEGACGAMGPPSLVAPFLAEGLGRTLLPHTQTVAWLPESHQPAFAWVITSASAFVGILVVAQRRAAQSTPSPRLFGLTWWGFSALPLVPLALAGEPVPESGLYLAVVGPCLWLGRESAAFMRWFRHVDKGPLATGLMVAIIVLLGARTTLRSFDWRDDFLLHLAAAEDEPFNPEALYRFGTHLALEQELLAAPRALSRAYQVAPERIDIANNLGATLILRKEFEFAEKLLTRAAARVPKDATVRFNLAMAKRRERGRPLLFPP